MEIIGACIITTCLWFAQGKPEKKKEVKRNQISQWRYMTIEESEMTQEDIDNAYRQLQVNNKVTEEDLLSFYDMLFMSTNVRHYGIWLQKATRRYEEASSIRLLLKIGKVESLLEKVYASY